MALLTIAASVAGTQHHNAPQRPKRLRSAEPGIRKEPLMPSEPQDNAFDAFYKAARYNKILDPKTTVMIHLATAMSAGCHP